MSKLKAKNIQHTHADASSQGFEALFMEHWTSVFRILRRLVDDPAEAEDLALEAFLRLYRQKQNQLQVLNAGGWLYQVATYLGLNSIRDRRRREQYELKAGQYVLDEATQHSLADILIRKEERRQVQLVLAQMNERQSQILILRYSGLSYKAIASALNLAPASIGPLLVRAEREFEKRYRRLAKEGT